MKNHANSNVPRSSKRQRHAADSCDELQVVEGFEKIYEDQENVLIMLSQRLLTLGVSHTLRTDYQLSEHIDSRGGREFICSLSVKTTGDNNLVVAEGTAINKKTARKLAAVEMVRALGTPDKKAIALFLVQVYNKHRIQTKAADIVTIERMSDDHYVCTIVWIWRTGGGAITGSRHSVTAEGPSPMVAEGLAQQILLLDLMVNTVPTPVVELTDAELSKLDAVNDAPTSSSYASGDSPAEAAQSGQGVGRPSPARSTYTPSSQSVEPSFCGSSGSGLLGETPPAGDGGGGGPERAGHPTLSKEEAREYFVSLNQYAQKNEISMNIEHTPEGGGFNCTLTWGWSDNGRWVTERTQGWGVSKANAKGVASYAMLLKCGLVDGVTGEERRKTSYIRESLDSRNPELFSEIFDITMELINNVCSPGCLRQFLVPLWTRLLAMQDQDRLRHLLQAITYMSRIQPLPPDLWEQMVDVCCYQSNASLGEHILRQLVCGEECTQPTVDRSCFVLDAAAEYFIKFRSLIALDIVATLKDCATRIHETETVSDALPCEISQITFPQVTLSTSRGTAASSLLASMQVKSDDLFLIYARRIEAYSLDEYEQQGGSADFLRRQRDISFVGRLSSVNYGHRHCIYLHIQCLSEDALMSDVGSINTRTHQAWAYPLSKFCTVTNSRMVQALAALVGMREVGPRRRSCYEFSPAIQHLLLMTSQPLSRGIACREPAPPLRRHRSGMPGGRRSHSQLDEFLRWAAFPVTQPVPTQVKLTMAQEEAVRSALTNRLTVVQGPPGTGKTHIACAIIDCWTRVRPGEKILAVANTNVAADNIAEGLRRVGVHSVRIGQGGDIEIQDEVLRNNSKYAEYLELLNNREIKRAQSIRYLMLKEEAHQSDVIITTCIGSGNEIFEGQRFKRVLIDECAQSIESTNLVPLGRGCETLVVIGDHKQLPPTVVSKTAQDRGFSVSLLERFVNCGITFVHFLDQQRRMHPSIAEFPNRFIYGGRLMNANVSERNRPPIRGFCFPHPRYHVCLINVAKDNPRGNEQSDRSSKYNLAELGPMQTILESIYRHGGIQPRDIGLLTPYKAQEKRITQYVHKHLDPNFSIHIDIDSVDGFQGKEKDLIIFSVVRSNDQNELGFVVDFRRLNVMLTRARCALIVILDVETLGTDSVCWGRYIEWAKSKQIVIDSSEVHRFCAAQHPRPEMEAIAQTLLQQSEPTEAGGEDFYNWRHDGNNPYAGARGGWTDSPRLGSYSYSQYGTISGGSSADSYYQSPSIPLNQHYQPPHDCASYGSSPLSSTQTPHGSTNAVMSPYARRDYTNLETHDGW